MRKARIATMVAVIALVGSMAMPASATGTEGCTPGFWKTHPEAWSSYTPSGNILSAIGGIQGSTVGLPSSISFETALGYGGGSGLSGGAKILLRAAAAAYLNAAADDDTEVWYPLHRTDSDAPETGIGYMVQQAWGNRANMISLAATLDGYNNLGAPLCGWD